MLIFLLDDDGYALGLAAIRLFNGKYKIENGGLSILWLIVLTIGMMTSCFLPRCIDKLITVIL